MRPMLLPPRRRTRPSAAPTVRTSSARTLVRDNDELLLRRNGAALDGVAQDDDVARGAVHREAARVAVDDGRGGAGVALLQRQARGLVGAREEVRLPVRGAGVEVEGAGEIAAFFGDAAEEVVADAELRAGHVGDGPERRLGRGVALVVLADAD